jgi:hypothetical protein
MNKSFKSYLPLVSLILIAALAACALRQGTQGTLLYWMHYFMGFLFCQFAMLKLFHLSGFADGFQMYDLIAKRSREYAFVYPFIELGLGLGYLSFAYPIFIYLLTILIAILGAIGVITALKKGLDLRCACMGTILDVPLSTVTLTEDLGMGAMALIMLVNFF